MKKHRIGYGILVLGLGIVFFVSDRRDALLLWVCALTAPVLTAILQSFAAYKRSFEMTLKNTCMVGESPTMSLKFFRGNALSMGKLRVILSCENLLYGNTKHIVLELIPREKKTQEFLYPLLLEDCGCVRVKVEEIVYTDLLGLFYYKEKTDLWKDVLVRPAKIRLDARLVRHPETKTVGEYYDPYRQGQDVSEASGLREYQPGDALGSIHWKLSGKLDQLVIREFGYPSNFDILILYELLPAENNRCNNAVLSLTTALSYSMLEHGLEHNVGRMVQGECRSMPVYSVATQEQMADNILYSLTEKETRREDVLYQFGRSNMKNEFTKMIYITSAYEEASARELSGQMDLTVICVMEGAEHTVVETAGYVVIPVDAARYRDKVYSIAV